MSKTQGRWEQQTPFTDGQIFVGANLFAVTAGAAVLSTSGPGLLTQNMTSSQTVNLFSAISTLLRTGQLATAAINQEYYGTAASVPGPSAVANTSDPLALPPSFPPWLSSVNPTLTGGNTNAGVKGPIPKGLQVNYVDCIYETDTGAITSATFGLTQTKMPVIGTPAAPVVANIIALGANGLPVAANTAGQATRTRILNATPAFVFLDSSEIIANINFVIPAANSVKLYGIILGATFNYN